MRTVRTERPVRPVRTARPVRPVRTVRPARPASFPADFFFQAHLEKKKKKGKKGKKRKWKERCSAKRITRTLSWGDR